MAYSVSEARSAAPHSKQALLALGLALSLLLLCVVVAISITQGAASITVERVYEALFAFDASVSDHLIIRTVRLPRVLAGVIVGAGLAVAGAMMQGLTHNPLASPAILGINAGASLAVVVGVVIGGSLPLAAYPWFAMVGATIAGVLVYGIASLGPGGPTPLRLTLAGAVTAAFMAAWTTALLLSTRNALDQVRFWTVGSLAGRDVELLQRTVPYVALGLFGALLLGRHLTTLSLGEAVARGLGQNTARVKGLSALCVILLAGGSVALAGPVGFVGLVVPHVVRILVGYDYRWILPYAALWGSGLVTLADMAGRIVLRPQEVPVGVMLAFVGAPFFILLARRLRR